MDQEIDYLKIGKATDLEGRDRKIYRVLEIFPGFFSITTLIVLVFLSYFKPVWVAYFIIAFDVYWLLLVIYMAIFLIASYRRLKAGMRTDWRGKCAALSRGRFDSPDIAADSLARNGVSPDSVWQLVVIPTYEESEAIISECLQSLVDDGFRADHMIIALTFEERAGLAGGKGSSQVC